MTTIPSLFPLRPRCCQICRQPQKASGRIELWTKSSKRRLHANLVVCTVTDSSSSQSTSVSTPARLKLSFSAPVSPRQEAQKSAAEHKAVYDKLIKIFQERSRDEWKRLIVMSAQWPKHCDGVFTRIKEMSDSESDIEKKLAIRRFYRSLQNVHDEVGRYNTVLTKFQDAGEEEWEAVVTVYRNDLQKPFFEHMEVLIASSATDLPRQEALVALNTKLLALVSAHDTVSNQKELVEAAGQTMKELLEKVSSVEDMDAKLQQLADEGRIDPAFLHITAKAYGNAKDRDMKEDEVKDLMFRMYIKARDVYQQKQPREERILKYLVKIDDAPHRWSELEKAVTPGPEVKNVGGLTHDFLWTTPQRLFRLADAVVKTYDVMREQAKGRMRIKNFAVTPKKVKVLREIRDRLQSHYL